MATRALSSNSKGEEHWLGISDIMSCLMMIFLFIAISYISVVHRQMNNVTSIAIAYRVLQDDLYLELEREFKDDLIKWDAAVERETLSVRFNEPEVLFETGRSVVTSRFRNILKEFFPRYLNIIYAEKYRDYIEEIRIEGHTSSEWDRISGEDYAYFNNMHLSQERTRSVLEYCMSMIQDKKQRAWARSFIMANGLSSSKPVLNSDGSENRERSRRVEFRTKTAAEKKIFEIINQAE